MKTTSLTSGKIYSLLAVLPLLLAVTPVQAQQGGPPPPIKAPPAKPAPAALSPAEQAAEVPFDLDFEGGPVGMFVTAVEAASKEPFNVIIPESAKELRIPPVRVRGVTLSRLLAALSLSSVERKAVVTSRSGNTPMGGPSRSVEYYNSNFSFTATSGSGGAMVWQLVVDKPVDIPPVPASPPEPPMARFYQLKANLEAGVKVEDVTTVAQTAWQMMKLDAKNIPELKVHEETGILIAVGQAEALQVLDSILQQLPSAGAKTSGPASPSIPGGGPVPPPRR